VRRAVARTLIPWTFAVASCAIAIAPVLQSTPVPLAAQPFPDAQQYADEAYQIALGHGFVTRIDERFAVDRQSPKAELRPPRYPPGFALALAPFVHFGSSDPSDAQTGTRTIAIALVLIVAAAATMLGGPIAGGIAALAIWASPFVATSARFVLSDAFGALLAVGALVAVLAARHERSAVTDALVVLAGAFAGYGVLTRVSAGFVLVALLAAVDRWRLRRLVAIGALPFLVFLAAQQWTQFGHPLRSGYDHYLPRLRLFGIANVAKENLRGDRGFIFDDTLDGRLMRWTCPCDELGPIGKANNMIFYPAVLLGLYWIYFPPLFSLFGVFELRRRRATAAARFAIVTIVANVMLMLPFFYQGARFVAPAAMILLAYAAAGCARLITGALGQRTAAD
jgi:4-amino-4-deoxy-L-arabinose transferase-like glycosyltransferase